MSTTGGPKRKVCARLGCELTAAFLPCLILHFPSGKQSVVRFEGLELCGPHGDLTEPEHLITDESWPELCAMFEDDPGGELPVRDRCVVKLERTN